jgi:hypothetical protein
MLFIGRSKSVALWCLIGGTIVGASFAGARELFSERLVQAYNPETGWLGDNVYGRMDTWWAYLSDSTARDYLLGQGAASAIAKHGMESHNAYISLLTVYGAAGAVWGLVSLVAFVRRVQRVQKVSDPAVTTVAAGAMWALVFWGIYAFTADAITSSYARYLLFYVMVLVDRAHALAVQLPERAVVAEGSLRSSTASLLNRRRLGLGRI